MTALKIRHRSIGTTLTIPNKLLIAILISKNQVCYSGVMIHATCTVSKFTLTGMATAIIHCTMK